MFSPGNFLHLTLVHVFFKLILRIPFPHSCPFPFPSLDSDALIPILFPRRTPRLSFFPHAGTWSGRVIQLLWGTKVFFLHFRSPSFFIPLELQFLHPSSSLGTMVIWLSFRNFSTSLQSSPAPWKDSRPGILPPFPLFSPLKTSIFKRFTAQNCRALLCFCSCPVGFSPGIFSICELGYPFPPLINLFFFKPRST